MTTVLDNLNEDEIQHLYELFFGPILVKHKDFSYLDNIVTLLAKPNSTTTFVEKLNSQERKVLEYLSRFSIISEEYLKDKLNIILDMQLFLIEKIINILVAKNYIFRRGDCLVIPQIFFPKKEIDIKVEQIDPNNKSYFPKAMEDVNNLINYFLCQRFNFSNQLFLYKKDAQQTQVMFENYATLEYDEYNFVSFFFANAFFSDGRNVNLYQLKEFFNMNILERALYILEVVCPSLYSVLNHYYQTKQSVKIKKDDFYYLWEQSLLLQKYRYTPMKVSFNELVSFLKKIEIITEEDNDYILNYYSNCNQSEMSNVKISTNFNMFVSANSVQADIYEPTLFADMKNYNAIVEYEITENSVRRGVINGYTYEQFCSFLKNNNVVLPQNVDSTINQWFEKHGSYYYATGTIFFCNSKQKAKIINNLIENGFITAYELKKDEVFIIPEEQKENFFKFLDKSGINYFNKEPNIVKSFLKNNILQIDGILEGTNVIKDEE